MQEWEYEADRFAFDVLSGMKAALGTPLPGSAQLKTMILDVFSIMSFAIGNQTTESPDDTHPLPKHRIIKLYGLQNDAEFQQWLRMPYEESSGGETFFAEMLMPILAATGVVNNKAQLTQ